MDGRTSMCAVAERVLADSDGAATAAPKSDGGA